MNNGLPSLFDVLGPVRMAHLGGAVCCQCLSWASFVSFRAGMPQLKADLRSLIVRADYNQLRVRCEMLGLPTVRLPAFLAHPFLKGLACPSKTANYLSARLAIPYRGSISPGRGQDCYSGDCRQGRKHRWQKPRCPEAILGVAGRSKASTVGVWSVKT